MELNEKLLEKAKNAKSTEELSSIAMENGIELTNEEAKSYFAKLNAKTGEVADDELEDVAGGGKCGTTYYENHPVVSAFNSCEYYKCTGTENPKAGCGMCQQCCYSKTVGSVFPILVCYNSKRYDN